MRLVFFIVVLWMVCSTVLAGEGEFADSYQLTMLYYPTKEQLQAEQQGLVGIYIGLTDNQVDIAMDKQFHRIDAMMFANIIRTDDSGEAMRDSITGEILVEEDGCD